MYSEFLLIRKMKQGNEDAQEFFVRKYYPEILNYCYSHCFDRMYAEDLTQETFVRFFTKLSDYHYRGKTLNYLYTIAGNLCKDYLKKRREIPIDENGFLKERITEENQNEQVIDKVLITQALRELSGEFREVVELYYFQERTLSEISEILCIGLPLVKYRLQKAKRKLVELLGKEEEDG